MQKVCFPGVVRTAGANSCDDPFDPSDNSRSIHPQTKEYLCARGVNRAQQVKPAYRRLVRQPTLDLLVGRGGHYLRGRPTNTNRNPRPKPEQFVILAGSYDGGCFVVHECPGAWYQVP